MFLLSFDSGQNLRPLRVLWLLFVWPWMGCSSEPPDSGYGSFANLKFKDDVQSNAQPESSEIKDLVFTDRQGGAVDLKQYLGKKNIVLVVTRGFTGSEKPSANGKTVGNICMGCSTQTSGLIANYPEFQKRNTEVLVVFPVARQSDTSAIDTFASQALNKPSKADDAPFPIALDIGLKGVDILGIRKDLSKPATYILDKTGEVRFAYVGTTLSDRPSVKAMLAQLDQINQAQK